MMPPNTPREHHSLAAPMPQPSRTLKAGFWVCIIIGIAVVLRRAFTLQRPVATGGPSQLLQLDAFFQTRAVLTRVHIFTALLFVCLLPFMFWNRTRNLQIVRVLFYVLGVAVCFSAFGMSAHPVGGAVEGAAILFYNSLFFVSLVASYRAWRTGREPNSLRWTLRATAVSLGIATTRPVMGLFFATSRLTHWTPELFFGPAFWIGFSINSLVMEVWLRKQPRFSKRSLT